MRIVQHQEQYDVQHNYCDSEGRLGQLAVVLVARLDGHAAALGKVPGRRAGVSGVGPIRTRLTVDADGVQGGQDQMRQQAKDGIEDVHDVQHGLDQQGEHGHQRDGHIPVGDAEEDGSRSAPSCYIKREHIFKPTIDSTPWASWGSDDNWHRRKGPDSGPS